jgi:CRISPR-associated endonuclease Csn1
LEQKYRSPYTGEVIPLSKLFTPAYEIEHIIPQSRYFDDSYSNKVICESEVNKLKDKMLGYEFIKNNENRIVTRSNGLKPVHIFTVEAYEQFIKDNYSNSNGKMKHLLMDDIPEEFIERQLNDSRYISKFIIGLLSNIVREESEDGDFEQEATSKNVISCVGQITDRLKRDWGINDVWNSIIYPRFERLNSITGSNDFGHWEDKEGKRIFQITMPLELQKGFNKKRIDHRHHAMDAIVIACATRNIVNFLNNESARKDARISRYDLQHLLCEDHSRIIKKPWETFTQDVKASLVNIIVSFKQNMRVINKTSNYYQHYNDEGKKVLIKQVKGDSWAIRKPLHKETIFGAVNLHRIKSVRLSEALKNPSRIVDKKLRAKVYELIKSYNNDMKLVEKCLKDNAPTWKFYDPQKIQIYYYTNETKDKYVAVRKPLDTSFTDKVIAESVTDTGIQKILLRFLKLKNNDANIAFSPDGIEEMNGMIKELNDGKYHQPIYKVRKMEILGNKFNVGETGSKINKYVEAEKGTNLFFAIYQHDDGSRVYDTIPLNIVVEREKEGPHPVPETNADNDKLLFYLSPNDFVYIPDEDERINGVDVNSIDRSRIYKMVSATGHRSSFIPSMIANPIVQTTELGPNNKSERAWTNEMIKEICIPVKVNRIGQIMKI